MPLGEREVERLRRAASWPVPATGRYTIVEEVGRGGMGVVYRARDLVLGRDVALKVTAAAPAPALDERLAREARVLARLEHPGIVPVHDAGELEGGGRYYAMKLVRGETLETHLARIPGLQERLRLFVRIAEPVAFAHSAGCIHRDLKPGNVMIGSFGEVLVMDWGVSKLLGEPEASFAAGPTRDELVTDPGTVMGTAGFMPPEQAAGSAAEVDRRADVYSLGAILAWMTQGFRATRPLRSIVARASSPDPAARYPDAAALARDVERFLDGLPVEAHRESFLERANRRLAPYRVAVILVLAYLAMRALVAVLFRL